MYNCPHCGEPLDDDAEFCRHCGSDAETGWKPDVDYYSVEFPEDDAPSSELPPATAERQRGARVGYALLAASLIAFAAAGFLTYGWGVFLPMSFLAACATLFWLHVKRQPGSS
jgi:hypothetical protein